jgi:hypothetical protein
MIGDAGNDVAKISLGVEPVHLCGLDESVHGGGPNAAGIGAGEEIVFSGQRNLAAILPMSGKMWWSPGYARATGSIGGRNGSPGTYAAQP